MISLIVGTNRPGSSTSQVARNIDNFYRGMGVATQIVDLGLLPSEIYSAEAYAQKPAAFASFSEAVLRSAGLVVITPEYNGSMPGVLKLFIDHLKFPESFEGKPVCFVGVAAGQWGALRAVEQLQQVFAYRSAHLYPARVFLPNVNSSLNTAGEITDAEIVGRLKSQAEGFVKFVETIKGCKLSAPTTKGCAARFVKNLAVCTWSLQPESPEVLVQNLKEIGISRVQLALDPLREKPEVWGKTADLFRQHNISIVSGMFGCVGEDYTTLDTIKQTGGVVPDHTWEQNYANIKATALLAQQLGIKLLGFHAGFLPHDPEDPAFAKLVDRLRRVAEVFAARDIEVAFETGQETAATLREFLTKLNCPNVGVNFDPANMILYDKGNPTFALRILGPWVKHCHLKDANRTKQPGTWGEEVVLGTGEVNWPAFFQTMAEINFSGNLAIEREAGNQRVKDIATARQYVENL